MKRDNLIEALRRLQVETGSLACLGCGHEHNCSTQGCAILREAVKKLENSVPAAGVAVSRRSSAWIWSPDGERVCITCGGPVSFSRTSTGWIEGLFCQTCGARMNGSREEDGDGNTDPM